MATAPAKKTRPPVDLKKIAGHPVLFGIGVGLVNGVLAKTRKKQVTARGALATSLILALGETVLSMDETPQDRSGRPPAMIGAMSAAGVLLGLAGFTNWKVWAGGSRPVLIATGGAVTSEQPLRPSVVV